MISTKNAGGRHQRISRLNFSLTALMLVYFVSQYEASWSGHVGFWQVFRAIMVAVFAILWFVSTLARLDDLGRQRIWILVFISLFIAAVYAKSRGQSFLAGGELVSVLLAQSPLMFLPARDHTLGADCASSQGT
jgi:hypothetical protein